MVAIAFLADVLEEIFYAPGDAVGELSTLIISRGFVVVGVALETLVLDCAVDQTLVYFVHLLAQFVGGKE